MVEMFVSEDRQALEDGDCRRRPPRRRLGRQSAPARLGHRSLIAGRKQVLLVSYFTPAYVLAAVVTRAVSDQVEQGTSAHGRLCRRICGGCMFNLIGDRSRSTFSSGSACAAP